MRNKEQPAGRRVRVGRRSVAFCILLAMPMVAGAQALPREQQCSLFANVSLLTMDGAPVDAPATHQDVLVCGETVRAIGATGALVVPDDAVRIEAAGKVLMPGLVDGHVHVFAPLDLELNLAWGITTVRNMFGNPMVLLLRKRVRSGEIWGPRIWTAGPIVDGDPPVWPGSAAVATAAEARRAVKDQSKAGYDFIKVYSLLRAEPFFAAIEAAKAEGLKVGGHVPTRVPLEDAVKAGIDFIEHLTGFLPALQGSQSPWLALTEEQRTASSYSERSRLQVEGFDPRNLAKVTGWMVEHEVWNTPTFVVVERLSASAEQKKKWLSQHPQMRTVSQMTENFWNPENDFRLQNVSPEELATRQRAAKLHIPIVKALHDGGAELMLGTDTPNPFVFPGYSVHEELQRFVEAGLTPWQALRTATVQPARFLGEEQTFGRVVVGLAADLLLLDRNPLQDIRATSSIAGVMSRGRWLNRAALDQKLTAVAKSYGKE